MFLATRIRRLLAISLGLCLALAYLGPSIVIACEGASAEGPFFKLEGKRVEPGELGEITAKASKSYVLKNGTVKITITCTKVGESEGSPIFDGCTVTGNGEPCEVEGGKITINPLEAFQAFSTATRTGKLIDFTRPATGNVIAKVKFTGSGCTNKETAIEGSYITEDWTGGKAVEVGVNEKEALTIEENEPATAIKTAFIEEGGKLKEVKTKPLEGFGSAITVEGRSEYELVSKKKYGIFTK